MHGKSYDEGSDSFSWNTDDDLEIGGPDFDATSAGHHVENHGPIFSEASCSSAPSSLNLFHHFVEMGFCRELVAKAIEKQNGEGNEDSILETLLRYEALENSPQAEYCVPYQTEQYDGHSDDPLLEADSDPKSNADSDIWSSDSDQENLLDHLFDSDACDPGYQVLNLPVVKAELELDDKMMCLEHMGYALEDAALAIERCGSDATIEELADFIWAAQMAREADVFNNVSCPIANVNNLAYSKRQNKKLQRKRHGGSPTVKLEAFIRLPKPMVGFGVPTCSAETSPGDGVMRNRILPEAAMGPPFFYYENVALAPKGVWDAISRFLHDVEPEFVDSVHFCAAARKRGYVHNLPIENRFPLVPLPPRTILEAFPLTRKWWPSWDPRTKLNCLKTVVSCGKIPNRIGKALEGWEGVPPLRVQKYVLDQCRIWNLVWVGRNKVAPLEPDEMEMILGFPRNHTRGGGISRTDRFKSLGNSFQVDTVAYHLSVLKEIFPTGIKMLSLFTGIGGAEVALHRLGVKLKVVMSVEKSEVNRNIVRSWWEQTNQQGILIDFPDVQQLSGDMLEHFINTCGGFDLVIGGSPCNNLSGSNRVSRDGLHGEESSLFFHYIRILDLVKCIMARRR